MWVRGLKRDIVQCFTHDCDVAPYVGAWIETYLDIFLNLTNEVAPYVGAWIETKHGYYY